MSPVEFKKRPCCPVEFKGQGPHISTYQGPVHGLLRLPPNCTLNQENMINWMTHNR